MKKSLLIKSSTLAFIFCLLSALGLVISLYYHSVVYLVFLINLVSLFFFKERDVICELFFLLPFTYIYKLSPTSSSIYTYIFIVYTLVIVIKGKSFIKGVIPLSLLFSLYLITGMGAITNIIKIITGILFMERFIVLIHPKDYSKIVLFLSSGLIFASIIGLMKPILPSLSAYYREINTQYLGGDLTVRFSGLHLDPNYYSVLVITCIMALLLFSFNKEIMWRRSLPMIVILLVFGSITYSRIFYIAITLIVLITFYLTVRFTKYPLVGFLSFVCFCFGIIVYLDSSGVLMGIFERFSEDDVSGGRFDIFNDYISYITSSLPILLFGEGLGAKPLNDIAPHNLYIESIYYLGVIGSFIYILPLVLMFSCRKNNGNNKRTVINYSLLIIIGGMFASLGYLFMNDFIYILIICWIVLNENMQFK